MCVDRVCGDESRSAEFLLFSVSTGEEEEKSGREKRFFKEWTLQPTDWAISRVFPTDQEKKKKKKIFSRSVSASEARRLVVVRRSAVCICGDLSRYLSTGTGTCRLSVHALRVLVKRYLTLRRHTTRMQLIGEELWMFFSLFIETTGKRKKE